MVLEALSSKSIDLNDSIMDSVTPERGLRSRTRRTSVSCEECGKDFSSTSLLKSHDKSAHQNKTKPRGSAKNRQLISLVPLNSKPPGTNNSSVPALSYDADSELLLFDTEESEVDVQPTLSANANVFTSELVSETLPARPESPPVLEKPLPARLESPPGMEGEAAPPAREEALEYSSGLGAGGQESAASPQLVSPGTPGMAAGEQESVASGLVNMMESTPRLETEVSGVLEPYTSSGLESPNS